jgi:MoaA/NifB/PqqE/SkfB family radical SAM enzyme
MIKKTNLSLLDKAKFQSIDDLIDFFQNKYPTNYFYKPVGIELEITNHCNLRCKGCPIFFDENSRPKDILKTDEFIVLLNQLKNTGIFAYSITGGEAFLRFETIKRIIASKHGLDLYKLNTNGSFFRTPLETEEYFKQLKEMGFENKNKYIKAVLVVSIGQQNVAGLPLANAVNAASAFYKIFDSNKVSFSLNVTDRNLSLANKIYKDFKKLYLKKTRMKFNEKQYNVRIFSLTNIHTLKRLKLPLGQKFSIKDLLEKYKIEYLSGGCFNIKIKNNKHLDSAETLIPRCMLRPNGDLYFCNSYNRVHKIGNILDDSFLKIFKRTNEDKVLKKIVKGNLESLYNQAVLRNPNIKNLKFEEAYGPCDACELLTKIIKDEN